MNRTLWTAQIALAIVFLFAGGIKLVLPEEDLTEQFPLGAAFLRFIGVAEIAGAFGLVVPRALRMTPDLTAVAAAGLVIIMAGATVITLADGNPAGALIPLGLGAIASFIAYHRRGDLRLPAQRPRSQAAG